MIAENFNVGTAVEYSCDEGHLLIGPSTRTCLGTGFYNEFPPVCKRKLKQIFLIKLILIHIIRLQEFNVVFLRTFQTEVIS